MIDFYRLYDLKILLDQGKGTSLEKNEYMGLLFNNGNIPEEQYQKFLNHNDEDSILKSALIVGGFVLLTWFLKRV